MALSATTRGTGGNNTTGTSHTVVPGSNMTPGTLGVLCIALDNAGSAGSAAAAPAGPITDSAGNSWVRRQDAIFDNGAASAGVEVAIYTATLGYGLTTGGSLVLSWIAGVSVVAKAWTLHEWAAAAGKIAAFKTGGNGTGATTGTPTVTTGSITSGDAVVGAGGVESADTWAGDADSTNGSWSAQQHTGFGTGTSGMSVTSQSKVVSATATQTYNPTCTSADTDLAWIEINEVNAYTLTAAQTSFTLTGETSNLLRGFKVIAAQAAVALTGEPAVLAPGPDAFTYKVDLVIDHTKVPSTQTDFPVLISLTDVTLKTKANGGQMRSTLGYDFRVFSDSAHTSALDYQIHSYDGTAGTITLRVRIASLSSAANTTLYCLFGNLAKGTDGSTTAVWDSNRKGYWPLSDGTTLNANDRTSNAQNLTAVASPTPAAGQVDGAATFNGTTQYLKRADTSKLNIGTSDFSFGLWIKCTAAPTSGNVAGLIGKGYIESGSNGNGAGVYMNSAGNISAQYSLNGTNHGDSTTALSYADSAWHRIDVTSIRATANKFLIYVDGILKVTMDLSAFSATDLTGTHDFCLACSSDPAGGGYIWQFTSGVDEASVDIGIARSADWITTTYNNESNPAAGGFFTSITFASNAGSTYTLTAAQVAFTLTGETSGLVRTRIMPGVQAAYALTGEPAVLEKGRTMTAASASFTLTGEPASLLRGRLLASVFASFALTGEPASVLRGRLLSAASVSFTLTGLASGLFMGHRLTAVQSSFTVTANAANLLRGRLTSAAFATFSLSGQVSGLRWAHALGAAFATFSLSGQAASLHKGGDVVLLASVGSFTLTGEASSLRRGFRLQANADVFVLNGLDVPFRIARILRALPASFSLVGFASGLAIGEPPPPVFIAEGVSTGSVSLDIRGAGEVSLDLTNMGAVSLDIRNDGEVSLDLTDNGSVRLVTGESEELRL